MVKPRSHLALWRCTRMSGRNRQRDRVVAVISSYQPTHDLVQHCTKLAPQVAQIIVVDDGSDSRASIVLEALLAAGITVEKLEENSGIGAAINAGFNRAREFSREFVVTFDQDSAVQDGFVDALVEEFDRLNRQDLRIGMVAPNYYSRSSQAHLSENGGYMLADSPIQSGLLIPMSIIQELGPQRADFFIDLIDTEYFCRTIEAQYLAVAVPGLVLEHGFGNRLYVHLFGQRLKKSSGQPRMVAVSSPFRYYYRARNRILLNRRYRKNRELKQLLAQQARNDLVFDFCVAIYCARGKFRLLRLMLSGWLDGLRNRTGKMPTGLSETAEKIAWKHPVALSE